MERILIAVAALAAVACNNPDLDDDGAVSPTEYCVALADLEGQSEIDCREGGSVDDGDETTCDYLAERCDFDEEIARACVARLDAFAATCEPGNGSGLDANPECLGFDFQGAVFSNCEFGE